MERPSGLTAPKTGYVTIPVGDLVTSAAVLTELAPGVTGKRIVGDTEPEGPHYCCYSEQYDLQLFTVMETPRLVRVLPPASDATLWSV
jgi:hypothetical protein